MEETIIKEIVGVIKCLYYIETIINSDNDFSIININGTMDYLDKFAIEIIDYIRDNYDLDCNYITECKGLNIEILI